MKQIKESHGVLGDDANCTGLSPSILCFGRMPFLTDKHPSSPSEAYPVIDDEVVHTDQPH